MKQAACGTSPRQRTGEAGFTLVETLVAIVILVFGLVAVTNLLLVAGSSSTVANAGSAATAVAVEQMEAIKATPFLNLVPGPGGANPLDADNPGFFRNSTTDPRLSIPGAGAISVRWSIEPVAPNIFYIRVRAEARGPLLAGRTRADYTSFRACTDPVPNAGLCAIPPCCPP